MKTGREDLQRPFWWNDVNSMFVQEGIPCFLHGYLNTTYLERSLDECEEVYRNRKSDKQNAEREREFHRAFVCWIFADVHYALGKPFRSRDIVGKLREENPNARPEALGRRAREFLRDYLKSEGQRTESVKPPYIGYCFMTDGKHTSWNSFACIAEVLFTDVREERYFEELSRDILRDYWESTFPKCARELKRLALERISYLDGSFLRRPREILIRLRHFAFWGTIFIIATPGLMLMAPFVGPMTGRPPNSISDWEYDLLARLAENRKVNLMLFELEEILLHLHLLYPDSYETLAVTNAVGNMLKREHKHLSVFKTSKDLAQMLEKLTKPTTPSSTNVAGEVCAS